ncbi:MAG: 4Fe-4S cluster-binding domain-containing protein, partial [Leptospiraceae bacterium]|nr:4Fe-4S cluster-binding domain-containing protein [Leptospiraceae bacterium]
MQLLGLEHFSAKVEKSNKTLKRKVVKTLQVNLGKLCNQACRHCHVDAGPNRTENMNEKDSSRILELLEKSKSVKALDLTGGAPELNPNFRNLI